MFNPFKKYLTESQKAVFGLKEEKPAEPAQKTENREPNTSQQYVTKDMILGDIVERFPQAVFVMSQFGLHCVGCHANVFDTVEAGAKVHGMSDEEIADMLAAVNQAIKEVESAAEKA